MYLNVKNSNFLQIVFQPILSYQYDFSWRPREIKLYQKGDTCTIYGHIDFLVSYGIFSN